MNTTAVAQSRADRLRARIREARLRSEELFSIVRPEALYDRPIPERHRIIFYVGHLEAFDWNLLREPLGLTSFHPVFDQLFAFGIDPVGGGLPDDQPREWPSVEEVRHYSAQLRETLDEALLRAATGDPALARLETGLLLEVAVEHRLMHAETLCYMLHQLPIGRKHARSDAPARKASAFVPHSVDIPAGFATLGLRRSPHGPFGWDNEFEEHGVAVPAFAIDAYKVTNQDFLRFVNEGAYADRSLWSNEGWEAIRAQNRRHPIFWECRNGSWTYRAMFEEIPLPLTWPVYVSHDEASAYAKWAGKELPSESEWHRAAYGTRGGSERSYPWGDEQPSPQHGNFDFRHWNPTPVGSFPAGTSGFGVTEMIGNGWEWTGTPFAPFLGFEPFSFYAGYSANFFDGKHFVMKGGSPRTASCMLRPSFRNWFQPHYPYVYATFRCVER